MGIASVDLTLEAITLVGGWNGAGKSSLLEATACAVTGTPLARGIPTKGKATALLREGAEAGSVSIKHERGTVRVDWPAAEVTTEGGAAQLGTALAIGAQRWMALDGKQRLAELFTRLALSPTEQDILTWLQQHDHKFKDEKGKDQTATVAASLFARVDEQGWDAVLKTAKEAVTKKRGAWEHVTGEKFGSTKSANWRPRVLEADENYSVDGAEEAVGAAKAAYDAAISAGAISGAALKRLEDDAARLSDLVIATDASTREVERLTQALERETIQLNNLPQPDETTLACPHCKAPVALKPTRGQPGVYTLAKPPKADEAMTERELLAAKRKREALVLSVAGLREDIERAQANHAAALRAQEAAERAATELAIERQKPKVDDEALGRAKTALAEAEVIRDAVKAMVEGKKIYEEIAKSLPLIEALEPNGVRAAKVAQGMEEFNAELAALSATAKFAEVQVTPEDGASTLGGRAYSLLSESERWRCDLIVGVALARREKAALFLVDRLDILHPSARPGVLYLLRDLGVPCLVGMTAKDKDALPALESHGLGRAVWIENGAIGT